MKFIGVKSNNRIVTIEHNKSVHDHICVYAFKLHQMLDTVSIANKFLLL